MVTGNNRSAHINSNGGLIAKISIMTIERFNYCLENGIYEREIKEFLKAVCDGDYTFSAYDLIEKGGCGLS